MTTYLEASDQSQEFAGYLMKHFKKAAGALLTEPFASGTFDEVRNSYGFTAVLNREPTVKEARWMKDEFNGIPVRWATPTRHFEPGRVEPETIRVSLSPG